MLLTSTAIEKKWREEFRAKTIRNPVDYSEMLSKIDNLNINHSKHRRKSMQNFLYK